MSRFRIAFPIRIFLLVLVWTGMAVAVGSVPNRAPVAETGSTLPRSMSPSLDEEIEAILTAGQAELDELDRQLDGSFEEEKARAILLRMSAVRNRTETAVLEAQVFHAEEAGDSEAVEDLRRTIAELRRYAAAREVQR